MVTEHCVWGCNDEIPTSELYYNGLLNKMTPWVDYINSLCIYVCLGMEMWFKTSQKMFPKKKNLVYTWEYDKAST